VWTIQLIVPGAIVSLLHRLLVFCVLCRLKMLLLKLSYFFSARVFMGVNCNIPIIRIEKICRSQGFGLHCAWGLLYRCRTANLQLLSDSILLCNMAHSCTLMFIRKCLCSESPLVKCWSPWCFLRSNDVPSQSLFIYLLQMRFNVSVSGLTHGSFSKCLVIIVM